MILAPDGGDGNVAAARVAASGRRQASFPPAAPLWRSGDDALGLYLHVPFCRSFCSYCDFARERYDPKRAEFWLDALAGELTFRRKTTWFGRPRVDTVFVGGGTPSALSRRQWAGLAALLRENFDGIGEAEFTSEANPESFSPETAEAMREAGVNRVSLGAQSLDAGELRMLGRDHDADAVTLAVHTARAAGFDNLSLDLIYGLPGGTERTLAFSLAAVLDLQPEHLSAYCLSLESGTRLAREVAEGTLPRPDDAAARRQYEQVVKTAARAGLALYEISNFARPGRQCRHNLRYWSRRDFLALGPSAHALLGGHRWANPGDLDAWAAAYSGEGERAPRPTPVPNAEARFEWVFLHLRLAEGFQERDFEAAWGVTLNDTYGPILERLVAGDMLERADGRVRLTAEARFVSDAVFAEFAPDR